MCVFQLLPKKLLRVLLIDANCYCHDAEVAAAVSDAALVAASAAATAGVVIGASNAAANVGRVRRLRKTLAHHSITDSYN